MNLKPSFHLMALLVLVATMSSVLSACTPSQTPAPASPRPATVAPTHAKPPTAAPTPTPTSIPFPIITLDQGDLYFRIAGQPSFILSRNLAGYQTSQYYQLLDLTRRGGSQLVRLQLDSLGMGYTPTGEVDEIWARKWEDIFASAAANGIDVMPTFGAWYDWNNGTGYSTWASNPIFAANGGPAPTPLELFTAGAPTQALWLGWLQTLIARWQGQPNIAAWEIFSEVNMVPGTTEAQAMDFVTSATATIHAADPLQRPVTASLADFGEWSGFYRSDAIDFINIHPYPVSGQLDRTIVSEVQAMLAAYGKPVMIGESGLSFETPDSTPPTLTTADRAEIGIQHAIWAAVVSGAMNGRALWWEDGVAIYFPALDLPFIQEYAQADLPAANFVRGVDFSGFRPLTSTTSTGVWGAALGNAQLVLGWYRDAGCEPPHWDLRPVLSGQTVTLTVPGSAANWKIDFYNTKTGTDVVSSALAARQANTITLTLPTFTDDIAFKLYVQN